MGSDLAVLSSKSHISVSPTCTPGTNCKWTDSGFAGTLIQSIPKDSSFSPIIKWPFSPLKLFTRIKSVCRV